MNPWLVLGAIVVLAFLFVLLPVGVGTWFHYRHRKMVQCPVAREEALIQVDAVEAALDAALGGRRVVITNCSLWPGRMGCGQRCLEVPAAQMHDVAAR